MIKFLSALFLGMILPMTLFSQVPDGFNYQAVLRNSSGELVVNQAVSIRLSILSGGAEGDLLYQESHHTTTDPLGLIHLVVGSGSSPDDFTMIDWGSEQNYWMRVELNLNDGLGYKTMGSQQLMSVPFAMYARAAEQSPPVLRLLTEDEILNLEHPVSGEMLINTTSGELNVYYNDMWHAVNMKAIASNFTCGNLLVDARDGQTYQTVQIGAQCWMAENLNVGSQIAGDVNQSDNGVIEKYCYQNGAASCEEYGGLYQWNELMDYSSVKEGRGICPEGWHIPSDYEVQQLEIALGMSASDAAKANTWRGTDQGFQLAAGGASGFNALFSGRRVTGGLYTALEQYEYLWTSTESGDAAWRRCFRVNDGTIGRYDSFPKDYGMSVRCVKD